MAKVSNTVLCARCHAQYRPRPAEEFVLARITHTPQWIRTATGYAVAMGWLRRTDGLLLCVEHARHGELPVRKVPRGSAEQASSDP